MRIFQSVKRKLLLINMAFYTVDFRTVELPSGRWGIFNGERLLLTVGSRHTLDMILMHLSTKQIPVRVLSDF